MNFDRLLPWIVAGIVGLACMATGALYLTEAMRRPPVRFEAVTIYQSDAAQVVVAAEITRDDQGCTNGMQADLRHKDTVTRLPSPQRTENSVGQAFYRVTLPNVLPGSYQIQIRELSFCPDVRVSEAPWLTFEVPAHG